MAGKKGSRVGFKKVGGSVFEAVQDEFEVEMNEYREQYWAEFGLHVAEIDHYS